MKKLIFTLVFVIGLVLANLAAASPSPQWVQKLPEAKTANQLFVVAADKNSVAWVSLHEKDEDGNWNQIMLTFGFVGRNGIDKKREGDGKTPTGTFKFTEAFGTQPDPDCRIPYTQLDENIYWSGDTKCQYNKMVDIRDYPELNKEVSEHLIDYSQQYIYALNISYNEKGVPDKGSAIFLHCFDYETTATSGGIAISQDAMLFVLQNVTPECAVIIDSFKKLVRS